MRRLRARLLAEETLIDVTVRLCQTRRMESMDRRRPDPKMLQTTNLPMGHHHIGLRVPQTTIHPQVHHHPTTKLIQKKLSRHPTTPGWQCPTTPYCLHPHLSKKTNLLAQMLPTMTLPVPMDGVARTPSGNLAPRTHKPCSASKRVIST